jgi:hypothetical protein
LHRAVLGWGNRAVGTTEDTGKTAYAFIVVYGYDAVRDGKRTGNTALNAKRLVAVTAGNGETDPVFFLNFDFWPDFDVFQRPSHVFFVGSGKSAVIFAQMAAQTPLFVYIDLLHSSPPVELNAVAQLFIPKMGVLVKGGKGFSVCLNHLRRKEPRRIIQRCRIERFLLYGFFRKIPL